MKSHYLILSIMILFTVNFSMARELIEEDRMLQYMLAEDVFEDVPGFGLTKIAKHEKDAEFSPNNNCNPWRGRNYASVACGAMASKIKCTKNDCHIHDAFSGKIVRVNDGSYGEGAALHLSASLCHITKNQGCANGYANLKNFMCVATYTPSLTTKSIIKVVSCGEKL